MRPTYPKDQDNVAMDKIFEAAWTSDHRKLTGSDEINDGSISPYAERIITVVRMPDVVC